MDTARKKFAHLMGEIEDFEDRVENLTEEIAIANESPNPGDIEVVKQEIRDLNELLTYKRKELARISNGCGTPH